MYAGVTSHFTTHVEALVVIVEVVLLLGFAFPLWSQRVDDNKGPGLDDKDVIRIRAVGQTFLWNFHYAGEDTRFGLIRPDRIDAINPVGIVREDLNAEDDFVVPGELVIPVGKTIIVQVTSKDVIHNLALVPMRTQQDAIPGMELPMRFEAIKEGEWDIVCAQLCGAGHATMKAKLTVLSQEDFDAWFAEKAAMAAAQNAPPAPSPAEPAPAQ
ncbi:MAG: cytochrome c oxidase subunit 2 [Verrucomicrobiales bacterium]